MNLNLIVFFNTLENIAVIVGATIAAIYFNRPALLAWYILALLNSYSIKLKNKDKEEKENE